MSIWYPYTQMKDVRTFPIVKKGKGTRLILKDNRVLIDGISSWWSAIHGYNNAKLNKALIDQVKKFSHIMLGGLTHKPALQLAKKLVKITPAGLNHVFFSDSGSVAVEVSLKMAIQYWVNEGSKEKDTFLSLTNSYHGDTFKAMEVSDDSDYDSAFSHVIQKGCFVSAPAGGFENTDIETAVEQLETSLKKNHQKIAAFILEPIAQCAGGFNLYSPLYLNEVRRLCDLYHVLLIFDEVATGFGRTGKLFASEHALVSPDILILGKALTGGYIGHAATIANTKVYSSFLGDGYDNAFMHGPTFMGNPIACAVALKSIEIFKKENYLLKIKKIEQLMLEELEHIQSHTIKNKRVLGAIAVIEVVNQETLDGIQEFTLAHGIWIRPIGNIIYVMPAYIIKKKELKKIFEVLKKWFAKYER